MESNSANKFFDALAAGRPVAINYGGWHRRAARPSSGAGIALPEATRRAAADQLAALLGDAAALARCRTAAARRWRRRGSTATRWRRSSPSVLERVAGVR